MHLRPRWDLGWLLLFNGIVGTMRPLDVLAGRVRKGGNVILLALSGAAQNAAVKW